MVEKDIKQRGEVKKFLDYTFLYNPDPEYQPITKEQLLDKSWKMVGSHIEASMASFANKKGEHYGFR